MPLSMDLAFVIAGLYFQTRDMIAMDLASLVAVSVVAVACSLLSLLLATLCWHQWETKFIQYVARIPATIFHFFAIVGLYFQTSDMVLASLVAVSVVAVACSLLSLLLATLCWHQWETSRPSHTYCAKCLYGVVRLVFHFPSVK